MAKRRRGATATDATALEIFQNQWDVYRKFLKYDYLSNAEAARALRAFLTGEVARPYRFLDLACGDASGIVPALEADADRAVSRRRPVRAGTGAGARTTSPRCPARSMLDEADFSTAMRGLRGPEDIVWISLSLHHLDTDAKLAFMREVRAGSRSGRRVPRLRADAARRRGSSRLPRSLRGHRSPRVDRAHADRVRRGAEARAHVRSARDGVGVGAARPRGRISPHRASSTRRRPTSSGCSFTGLELPCFFHRQPPYTACRCDPRWTAPSRFGLRLSAPPAVCLTQ